MVEEICRFCGRVAIKTSRGYSLCCYHLLAYDNLHSAYEAWKERLGELTWGNFLRKASELPDTGAWVKDVALAELQKEQ